MRIEHIVHMGTNTHLKTPICAKRIAGCLVSPTNATVELARKEEIHVSCYLYQK